MNKLFLSSSLIMSKDINYVEKIDDKEKVKKLTDYNALNIVDFYTLPHHTNEPFKSVVEEIILDYKDKIDLIPISNTEVIQVNGKNIKVNWNKTTFILKENKIQKSIVQNRLEAYNQRNLNKFLSFYSSDIIRYTTLIL